MMNKQTIVIIKGPYFLAGVKEGTTTMVEVNITVETDDTARLQELLTHIVLEITDEEYRIKEISTSRKVDMNWVYLDEGKYQWSRNDRT